MVCILSLELDLVIFHNKDRLLKLFLITLHSLAFRFGKNSGVGITT